MIVDAHLHLCPRGVSSMPGGPRRRSMGYGLVDLEGRRVRYFPPSFYDSKFSPEMALAFMDWAGVGGAFLLQGAMYGLQNEEVAQAVWKWPEKFLGFAMVDPRDGERSARELELWHRHGIRGLKVEVPGFPGMSIVGEREREVWAKCAELGIILALHLDPSSPEATDGIRAVAEEFPEMDIIICHMGLPPKKGWEERALLAKLPNVYLELSGLPALYSHEGYPYPGAKEAIRWTLEKVGPEKVLWGSDAPSILTYCTYPQTLEFVSEVLDGRERELVLGGNALSIRNRAS
ncbi:MAG TPA: amidohydrolase [Candidatus Latescibacteria bacterium]|nr:amidohydrolase [Candidatus Latescibacterota bacterium]